MILLTAGITSLLSYAVANHFHQRQIFIQGDIAAIERLCGGDTEVDRLLEVRFVKAWEYRALKRTPEGNLVWLHWKLSKRYCGNLTLVDPNQRHFIRPVELRFPNGVPRRHGFDCVGNPTYR